MLGVHASASAIIQYGKIARKQVSSHLESLLVLMGILTVKLQSALLLIMLLHYAILLINVLLTNSFHSCLQNVSFL